MRIAFPVKYGTGLDDEIEEHFGRARFYAIVEVDENGEIVKFSSREVPFSEHGPGDIPNWLKSFDVNTVIAWGMGQKAVDFFNKLGINVITGATGRLRDVIDDFINGSLKTEEWNHECGHENGGNCH